MEPVESISTLLFSYLQLHVLLYSVHINIESWVGKFNETVNFFFQKMLNFISERIEPLQNCLMTKPAHTAEWYGKPICDTKVQK